MIPYSWKSGAEKGVNNAPIYYINHILMTLTTHIAIAAAVTKPLASYHPIFAFLLALASHYLSDAIPHWDYNLASVEKDKEGDMVHWTFTKKTILVDLFRTGLDGILGTSLVIFLLWPDTLKEAIYIFSLIVGGVLPDFLQGVYHTGRAEFLKPLSEFHKRIHTKIKLGPYPLIGIPLQLIILLLSLMIL